MNSMFVVVGGNDKKMSVQISGAVFIYLSAAQCVDIWFSQLSERLTSENMPSK